MSMSGDNLESIEGIHSRARELALASECPARTTYAEVLAGLADGTVPFDSLGNDTLEAVIQVFGIDSVVEAFIQGAGQDPLAMPEEPQTQITEDAMASQTIPMPRLRPPVARAARTSWWRRPRWIAVAASVAVAAVLSFLVIRLPKTQPHPPMRFANLALQWPAEAPFDPGALKAWGPQRAPLPKGTPDFDRSTATLGAGGDDRFARWRSATVIVRTEDGWGSGAFVSGDGWLLTNYHVIAGPAQKAAVTGKPATVEAIMARTVEGRVRPQSPLRATVYRADPSHDLALLKLDTLPQGVQEVPYFPMGASVRDGEECFVIGSQNNGPAWWIRSGNVSQQFDFPEGLSQFAAGVASTGGNLDRSRYTVIVTDARVSPGDSGGPLLNARGELIGLTSATSANESGGSVGWHIALQHLRAFVADLPSQPEGVPFDAWTAGLPEAAMLEPELTDGDGDGRIDSLRYRYAVRAEEAPRGAGAQPVAVTVFVDFSQRGSRGNDLLDRVPIGLWGKENGGHFRFDLMLTSRADGVAVVGYANSQGIVDDVRVGRDRQEAATVVWRRDPSGKWHASTPATPVPLLEAARLSANNARSLQAITGQFVTAPESRRREDPVDRNRGGPNKQ